MTGLPLIIDIYILNKEKRGLAILQSPLSD